MNEAKIIPLTNDRMFKTVLTSNETREYLIDIISEITGLPKKALKRDMVFKSTEHKISGISESKKTSDLVVEVKNKVINLEMNNSYYKKLMDRNFEYISKLKSNIVGESYNHIKKVIQINFDNFNMYKDERVIIKFEMRDERGLKEGVSLESYHVILPNVKEKYYNEDSKDDLIVKLVIFVTERDEELQKLIDEHIELRPVGKKIVEISRDEELNGVYNREEHERRVRNSLIEDALEDGWNRGKKEGIEKGIEKGIEQGIEQGINENRLKTAKALIDEKVSVDIITKVTGLTKDELNKFS